MSRTAFIGLGVAVFAGLFALDLWVVRPKIERDLARRTREALGKRAIAVKDARFSGRDGQIEIVDTGAGELAQATRATEGVFGVRVAEVTARTTRKASPLVKVERVGENVKWSGILPSEKVKADFVRALNDAYGVMVITEEVTIGEVSAPTYLQGFVAMVGLLTATAPEGFLELSGTSVRLGGETPDAQARENLRARAQELLPPDLRLVFDVRAPERSQVAQISPSIPQRDFRRELESTRLGFAFNSTQLTAETVYLVEPLVEMVKEQGALRLRIIGHADATGTDAYNEALSRRRSKSIAQLLIRNGVAATSLETEGRGESQPVADNTTPAGRAKNRRVEFELVEGS